MVMGPDIAAAAAAAAVSTLCDENPCARMAFDVSEGHHAKKVSSNIEPSRLVILTWFCCLKLCMLC